MIPGCFEDMLKTAENRKNWGERGELNPQPLAPQASALTKLSYAHRLTLARPAGFEPATLCLEGRCSIRLSYGRRIFWSGRADLNGRPPAPKAGALTKLRYAPLVTAVL